MVRKGKNQQPYTTKLTNLIRCIITEEIIQQFKTVLRDSKCISNIINAFTDFSHFFCFFGYAQELYTYK